MEGNPASEAGRLVVQSPRCPDLPGQVVFLLGAGANHAIEFTPFSDDPLVRPPMNTTLFSEAMKIRFIGFARVVAICEQVSRAIAPEHHILTNDLVSGRTTLEDCISWLFEGIRKREVVDADDRLREIRDAFVGLIGLLAETLNHLTIQASRSLFAEFGRYVLSNGGTIVTLNYDTYLESIFERLTDPHLERMRQLNAHIELGPNAPPPSDGSYSPFWLRWRAYGVPFDFVKEEFFHGRESTWAEMTAPGGEPLYLNPILKLHGSINWFEYGPSRLPGQLSPDVGDSRIRVGKTAILDAHWARGRPMSSGFNEIYPIIVPPIRKDDMAGWIRHPLPTIWDRAREALEKCESLVVIGYSLPDADGEVKELLSKSFTSHELSSLVVVTPDSNLVERYASVCGFKGKPIHHPSVENFLAHLKDERLRTNTTAQTTTYRIMGAGQVRLELLCHTCRARFPFAPPVSTGDHVVTVPNHPLACPNGHVWRYDLDDLLNAPH